MYCKNCGKEIPDHAKFCGKCGTPVSANISEQVEEPFFTDHVSYDGNRDTRRKKILVSLVVIAIAAVVLIVVAVRIHSNRAGDTYLGESIINGVAYADDELLYLQYIEPIGEIYAAFGEMTDEGASEPEFYKVTSDLVQNFCNKCIKLSAIDLSAIELSEAENAPDLFETGDKLVVLSCLDKLGDPLCIFIGNSEKGFALSDPDGENIYLITSDDAIRAFKSIESMRP